MLGKEVLFGQSLYLCEKIGCMIDELEIERLVKLELKKSDLTHKTEKQLNSYKEELYLMANLMNEDSNESCFEPKVGIFWFNSNDKQLFDVVTEDLQTALAKFPKSNEVTCSKLHKDVWKKELMKALAKKDSTSVEIHSKNYMDIPRGRIFYDKNEQKFIIKVGDWIDDFPEAEQVIVDTYELNDSSYELIKDYHWNIGNGWEM